MEQQTICLRNPVGRRYDRFLGKILPSSRLLAVLFCVLLNSIIYWGAQVVTAGRPMLDMTTALDERIPFVPAWAFIYVGAFLFWAAGYVLMARDGGWYKIMTAEVIAKLVCGVCFLLLPTTNVRPEVSGADAGSALLRFIYAADAAANLFPSIHCLESWICFAGVRSRRDIPRWYRAFSAVFAMLVCISTLTTRQHVIADVVAGVLLAEAMLQLTGRFCSGGRLERVFAALDQRLFGRR